MVNWLYLDLSNESIALHIVAPWNLEHIVVILTKVDKQISINAIEILFSNLQQKFLKIFPFFGSI